jgi:radical SAM superfamily enzyme
MPLNNPEVLGTEKDGTKNHDYCLYCYQNGSFLDPDIKLAEMKIIVQTQMEKRKIDNHIINMALKILPGLKRWTAAVAE